MVQSINIAIYELSIKEIDEKGRASGNPLKFDKIPSSDGKTKLDLKNILQNVFDDIKERDECLKNEALKEDNGKRIYLAYSPILSMTDEEKEKCEYIFEENDDRVICGIVRYGEGGNAKEIRNLETNITSGDVNEDEGVFEPFYFFIKIPKNVSTGCLILEQKNGRGIKGIFRNAFLDKLQAYTDFDHCKIDIARAFPEEIKEKYYEKGDMKSLRCIITEPPEDIIDQPEIEVSSMEILLKINSTKSISPKKFVEKAKKKLVSLKGYDYDEIKVISSYNGKPKIFNIENPETLIPYLDITDDIRKWKKGNPDLEHIDKIARLHANSNFDKIWSLD